MKVRIYNPTSRDWWELEFPVPPRVGDTLRLADIPAGVVSKVEWLTPESVEVAVGPLRRGEWSRDGDSTRAVILRELANGPGTVAEIAARLSDRPRASVGATLTTLFKQDKILRTRTKGSAEYVYGPKGGSQ